jgi:antitoxin component YwqK of YwqJK toxin-antitoxin module
MSNKQRIKTLTSHSKEDFDSQINFHLDIGWKLMKDGLNVTSDKFIQVMYWIDDKGIVTKFHNNGRIKSQEKHKNGNLYNLRKWYSDGSKLSQLEVDKDGQHFKEWYKNGNKKFDDTYRVDGTISTKSKWSNGRLIEKTFYHSNGKKSCVEKYSNDEYEFRQKWFDDGSIESIQDKKRRIYKWWYKGIPGYVECIYSKKWRIQSKKEWYEEGGPLFTESKYFVGGEVKEKIYYYRNGNIEGVKSYKRRKRGSTVKWYYESGSLKSEEHFDNSNCISMKIYKENGEIHVDWTSTD